MGAERRVLLSTEAEVELGQTVEWYARQRRGLGDRFLRSVDTALRGWWAAVPEASRGVWSSSEPEGEAVPYRLQPALLEPAAAAGVRHWREWYVRNRERSVDAVIDTGDWVPWRADVAMHLRSYAWHPKGFIRTMVLDR